MINPFHDDADRDRAAEFADRVVLALCLLLGAWMLPDLLGWLGDWLATPEVVCPK